MASPAIETVIKMIERLPEDAQVQVVEHLREYLEDLMDEMRWDEAFEATQPQLIAVARRAKQEIVGTMSMSSSTANHQKDVGSPYIR